jgi:hypothetical protein
MCQKLGIRIMAANSPQAKGRVERNHGIHQDRLVKKMRRKGIASYAAANQYLETEYLPEHNRRFVQAAAKPEDYHGRKPTGRELRQIFRLESERAIGNDWVIRHDNRCLQLQPKSRRYGSMGQSKALVCEWDDGTIEVYYCGEAISFVELSGPIRKPVPVLPNLNGRPVVVRKAKADHPWRQSYRKSESRLCLRRAQRHWLECALPLRPKGLRSSAHSNQQHQPGDISNELRMGTFLKSHDN